MDGITLEEATVDQMVDELARRFDGLILAYEHGVTPGKNVYCSYYRGGLSMCIGLAARTESKLLKVAHEGSEHFED